jgi:organic hydroperoxide reductase OsmC/OhrA
MLGLATMAVLFPQHHQTRLIRTLGSRARVEAPPRPNIAGGPSLELDGDAMSWSPEQLLLSSIGLCLLTTFEALAARDRVDLTAWQARVGGTVDQAPTGPKLTKLVVEVEMQVGDVEQAHRTLETARHHCMVTNALRIPVEIVARIQPAGFAGT